MATGRNTQLTRQIGEHLVVAKLGRLGYIATPFAGNVPEFDVLVVDDKGHSIPIQVKAINGPSWQFQADRFLDIETVDDVQIVKGKRELQYPNLVCVFVLLAADENDRYFVFRLRDLQSILLKSYKGGRRPKNPKSFHCAVWPQDLEAFQTNWELIERTLNAINRD